MSARHRVNTMLCQHDVLSKWHPSQTSTVYQHGVWSRRHRVKTTSCQHGVVPRRCRVIATPSWGSLASIRHRVIKRSVKTMPCQKRTSAKSAPCQHDVVPTRCRVKNDAVTKQCRLKTTSCQGTDMSKKNVVVPTHRCAQTTPDQNDVVSQMTSCQHDVVSTRGRINTMWRQKRARANTMSYEDDAVPPQRCAKYDVVSRRHRANTTSCRYDIVSIRRCVKTTPCQNEVVSKRCRVNPDPPRPSLGGPTTAYRKIGTLTYRHTPQSTRFSSHGCGTAMALFFRPFECMWGAMQ